MKNRKNIEAPALVTVVYMGDSVTFGQHVDPKHIWTTLVSEKLTEQYRDTAVNILSLNRGVSGETTRMGLERFPEDVQNHRPDLLVLQFGLNDCNCWLTDLGLPRVSEAAFRANLKEMIERARRFGTEHVVLGNNYPTLRYKVMLSGEPYEQANERYSIIVREVARETTVHFCDTRGAFLKYDKKDLERFLLPFPDQLHLSAEGHRIYAETLWPLIKDTVGGIVAAKTGGGPLIG